MNKNGTISSIGSTTFFSVGLKAGQDEGVDLVEQEREREQDPGVERELHRREERLGRAECERLERLRSRGSGLFAMSSSVWLNTKQTTIAISRKTPEMMIRLRSSSRCSTSVSRSSKLGSLTRGLGPPRARSGPDASARLGAVLSDDFGLDGLAVVVDRLRL